MKLKATILGKIGLVLSLLPPAVYLIMIIASSLRVPGFG